MAPKYFEFFIHFGFLWLPIFSALWFGIALFRYCYAMHRRKKGSRLYDDMEMQRRKIQLQISSVPFGIVVLGILVLTVLLLLTLYGPLPM